MKHYKYHTSNINFSQLQLIHLIYHHTQMYKDNIIDEKTLIQISEDLGAIILINALDAVDSVHELVNLSRMDIIKNDLCGPRQI